MGMNLKTINCHGVSSISCILPIPPRLAREVASYAASFASFNKPIIPSVLSGCNFSISWLELQENVIVGICPSFGKGFRPVTT
jgi:hypothetical protein